MLPRATVLVAAVCVALLLWRVLSMTAMTIARTISPMPAASQRPRRIPVRRCGSVVVAMCSLYSVVFVDASCKRRAYEGADVRRYAPDKAVVRFSRTWYKCSRVRGDRHQEGG